MPLAQQALRVGKRSRAETDIDRAAPSLVSTALERSAVPVDEARVVVLGAGAMASLAVAIGEDAMTLEEVYEPYLIQEGFLQRTARGREASKRAYRRFGYTLPDERKGGPAGQPSFFGE